MPIAPRVVELPHTHPKAIGVDPLRLRWICDYELQIRAVGVSDSRGRQASDVGNGLVGAISGGNEAQISRAWSPFAPSMPLETRPWSRWQRRPAMIFFVIVFNVLHSTI